MRDPLLLLAASVCCLLAFSWFALAMDVHWQQVRATGAPAPSVKRLLRMLAIAALAVSLGLCLSVDHATMASLVWVMLIAASALAVTFTLSWQPRWLAPAIVWLPQGASQGTSQTHGKTIAGS